LYIKTKGIVIRVNLSRLNLDRFQDLLMKFFDNKSFSFFNRFDIAADKGKYVDFAKENSLAKVGAGPGSQCSDFNFSGRLQRSVGMLGENQMKRKHGHFIRVLNLINWKMLSLD